MKLAAGFMATLRGNTAIQKLVRRKLIFLSVANSSVRVLAPKIESGGCCRSSVWVREQFRFWGTQLVLGFFSPLLSPHSIVCDLPIPCGNGGGDSSNTDG